MGDEKLIFAPLIRVSTEAQARKGESLNTQRKQLQAAIDSLGGAIYDWYAGQEHATPDHERKILDSLMEDALNHKFNAIMVTDTSRWSRDNLKSKEYLDIFRKENIKFYISTMELDLYIPTNTFILGMGVEVNEFFARQQAHRSILSRISKAEKGYPSSSGRAPYGRIFDKVKVEWTIDEEKKRNIEEAARLYLEEDVSFTALGKRFGIDDTYLWQILTQRCGDEWEQRFQEKRFKIDTTVKTKVPRLLPEETIVKIREKCKARRVWMKGSPRKNQYLFAHIVYDEKSGYTLSGLTNHLGQQHYRAYYKIKYRYMINAKVLEKAIMDALFQALSDNRSLTYAVFEGNASTTAIEEMRKRKKVLEKSLTACELKLSKTAKSLASFDDNKFESFMQAVKERVSTIEQHRSKLIAEIQDVQNQLNNIPTQEEIISKREWINRQLKLRMAESYLNSVAGFHDLPYDTKRKLILLIFGGEDGHGKRYGIYIEPQDGKPRKYKFVAYGRLGNIDGWLESKTGQFYANGDEIGDIGNDTVEEAIVKVIRQGHPNLLEEYSKNEEDINNYKARLLSKSSTTESFL